MKPPMAMLPDQYSQLMLYLDGRLAPEEETAFVQALNGSVELQKEFDFELLLRASLNTTLVKEEAEDDPVYESAATHLQKAKEILHPVKEAAEAGNGKAKIHRFPPHYKKIISAAALFLLVASLIVFYFVRRQNNTVAQAKPPVKKEAVAKQKDSAVAPAPMIPDSRNDQIAVAAPLPAQKAFEKYYARYQKSDEDPAIVSGEYNAYYYDKNYEAVLNAGEPDYGTKGEADSLPALYAGFYRALAWIETGRPGKAATQLDALLSHTDAALSLHASLQWYLAMAHLRANDTAAAKKELQAIAFAKNPSPYKRKASQLIKALEK